MRANPNKACMDCGFQNCECHFNDIPKDEFDFQVDAEIEAEFFREKNK